MPTPAEKDRFFQAMERDEQLFRETLEVALTIAVSDPKLTLEVANLIESDYRNVYLNIWKQVVSEMGSSTTMGCCRDLFGSAQKNQNYEKNKSSD